MSSRSTTPNPPAQPVDPTELSPFEDATELLAEPAELRARAARDGYLYFRGLLDPEPVLDLRRRILQVIDRHGLRAVPADDPLSGRLDLDRLAAVPTADLREDIGVTWAIYTELQKLPALHRLPHHPTLVGLYRVLLGAEVFVHPRHILRAMTPHPGVTATPRHQDFPLVQGSPDTWTCWIPVGDCPLTQGPLAVLRGSHRNGYLPIDLRPGAGGIAAQLCAQETDWVGGDLAVGDVLTFSSLTVHGGVPASARDCIRLSMDVRYQRATDTIERRALGNHAHVPWPEIYADWTEIDRDLMYYWDPARLAFVDWDDELMQPTGRRIC